MQKGLEFTGTGIYLNQGINSIKIMETAIWIIAILAVIVVVIIYVITSVGKYSNSFIGKYFHDKDEVKNKSEKEEL